MCYNKDNEKEVKIMTTVLKVKVVDYFTEQVYQNEWVDDYLFNNFLRRTKEFYQAQGKKIKIEIFL